MTLRYGRESVARYVKEHLSNLRRGSRLITTIQQVRSEVYSVSCATDMSWENTELQQAKFFSETQVNT
jgi:hypothetical protein